MHPGVDSETASSVCWPAISSHSLGRAWHHFLPEKLTRAAEVGFKGIELYYEDLVYHARCLHATTTPTVSNLLVTAHSIRDLCQSLELTIVCLQPFLNYEGLLSHEHHVHRIKEVTVWLIIARALGTNLIAVPSSFLPATETTPDMDRIVADLQELADLGTASPSYPIRFTYEALSFGTHVNTWEQSWEIVQRVQRPNFGLCLDTFNIAARIWADPSDPSGMVPDARENLGASLSKLVQMWDKDKIFYVQLVDGALLNTPLTDTHPLHVKGQPPRMSWSRNCRLFYGEEDRGGYLPVDKIARAIFEELGWRGWVSMELFNASAADSSREVPREHAERGIRSWERLVADCPTILQRDVTEAELKKEHGRSVRPEDGEREEIKEGKTETARNDCKARPDLETMNMGATDEQGKEDSTVGGADGTSDRQSSKL